LQNRPLNEWKEHTDNISSLIDLGNSLGYEAFVAGSWDGSVKGWVQSYDGDDEDAEPEFSFQYNNNSVTSLMLLPGRLLVSCLEDGTVAILDFDNEEEVVKMRVVGRGFESIYLTKDGRIITGSSFSAARTWGITDIFPDNKFSFQKAVLARILQIISWGAFGDKETRKRVVLEKEKAKKVLGTFLPEERILLHNLGFLDRKVKGIKEEKREKQEEEHESEEEGDSDYEFGLLLDESGEPLLRD